MTRSGIVNSAECIVCLRELSSLKTTQPNNPRKVFKVCSNYLKPDVFTKYTKWDLFSDQERESPFCSMCSTSAEKLTVMNDRLEEVQREIISFVKYFGKEVLRHRNRRNNDESSDDDNGNEEDRTDRSQSKASFSEDFLDTEDISRKKTRSSTRTTTNKLETKAVVEEEDFSMELDNAVVKEEIEEQVSAPEDDDYILTQEDEEEEDDDDDEDYVCKPKRPNKKTNEKLGVKSGSSNKEKSDVPTPGTYVSRRVAWKEISYSEEQVEKEWRKRTESKRKESLSIYYYCKYGRKHRCPARLLKKIYKSAPTRYFENGEPHKHVFDNRGMGGDLKSAILQILDENPNATTNFAIESLKMHHDIVIQTPESKVKLNNVLMYEKRKRLIKAGSYKKRARSNYFTKSDQVQDSVISAKRNPGRLSGSDKMKEALPPSSTADITSEIMLVPDTTATSNEPTQKTPSSDDNVVP